MVGGVFVVKARIGVAVTVWFGAVRQGLAWRGLAVTVWLG